MIVEISSSRKSDTLLWASPAFILMYANLSYFQREPQVQHGTQASPGMPHFCGVEEVTLASKASSPVSPAAVRTG